MRHASGRGATHDRHQRRHRVGGCERSTGAADRGKRAHLSSITTSRSATAMSSSQDDHQNSRHPWRPSSPRPRAVAVRSSGNVDASRTGATPSHLAGHAAAASVPTTPTASSRAAAAPPASLPPQVSLAALSLASSAVPTTPGGRLATTFSGGGGGATSTPSNPLSPADGSTPAPGAHRGAGAPHHHQAHSLSFGLQSDLSTSLLSPHAPPQEPALVVFSGGTAFNSVAGHLRALTTRVAHVLPVSDDGGSTAEVVRVLGGPAVGDIRSRCLRLADDSDTEARAVKALLAHRLPSADPAAAKAEWYSVVEGEHPLWRGVSDPYKHVIRAFLVHFHTQIISHASERFNFSNGSIGNFFFAGARTFFRSLEGAIFLFSRVARIPEGCTVLPAICTEEHITLGAELENGQVIRGQNNISHPPANGADSRQVDKSQHAQPALSSPIRRVFYLSSSHSACDQVAPPPPPQAFNAATSAETDDDAYAYTGPAGTAATALLGGASAGGAYSLGGVELEVLPRANPAALAEVARADAVLFGMGSLYTSICPTICLQGMGEAVAARQMHKVLVLNGSHDRETSRCVAHEGPMTAVDMVQAVADALNRRRNIQGSRLNHPPSAYVTGLLVPQGGEIEVDKNALHQLGVRYVLEVQSRRDGASGAVVYDPHDLVAKIGDMLRLPLPLEEPPAATAAAAGSTAAATPAP